MTVEWLEHCATRKFWSGIQNILGRPEGEWRYQRGRGDLFGGPVGLCPLSNAGRVGLIPGWGAKITYVVGQLSPHHSDDPLELQSRPNAAK